MRNKNSKIKCVLGQLSKRDGTVYSNTECHSYRKSANDSILSPNEKKTHNNSGEIHTDEKDLLNNNVLLHEESSDSSKSSIRFSKSTTKESKPREMKEQNIEFLSTSKQSNGQSQTKEKSVIILGDSMVRHLNGYEISRKLPSKCKVYVRKFHAAQTRCMKDYLKPS